MARVKITGHMVRSKEELLANIKDFSIPLRNGCRKWIGSSDNNDVPFLYIYYINHNPRRIAYEEHHGAIPDGHKIFMACKHKWCVNAEHMYSKKINRKIDNEMD